MFDVEIMSFVIKFENDNFDVQFVYIMIYELVFCYRSRFMKLVFVFTYVESETHVKGFVQ